MGQFDKFDYSGYLNKAISNYQTAINYYEVQKNLFLNMLNETNKEALKLNSQNLLSKLSKEVEMQFETEDFGGKTAELYEEIEKMVVNYLKITPQGAALKEKLNEIKKNTKEKEKLAKKEASELSDKIKKIIEKTLKGKQLVGLKTRIRNIYNKVYGIKANKASIGAGYGMFRRALIKEFTDKTYELTGQSKSGYTRLLAGYYAEAAIENVFSKWAEQSSIKVQQVGVSGGKTDVGIGLGNIEKQLEAIDKLSTNGFVSTDKHLIPALFQQGYNVFGIQSKSWGIPEDAVADSKGNYSQGYMGLGEDAVLWSKLRVSLNYETPYRGWHYNAYEISKNMLSAIGPANVLYRLKGNKMIWTHELIEDLMHKKYYLTFWFTHDRNKKGFGYPATTELAWQKVDNRMTYAKNSYNK